MMLTIKFLQYYTQGPPVIAVTPAQMIPVYYPKSVIVVQQSLNFETDERHTDIMPNIRNQPTLHLLWFRMPCHNILYPSIFGRRAVEKSIHP